MKTQKRIIALLALLLGAIVAQAQIPPQQSTGGSAIQTGSGVFLDNWFKEQKPYEQSQYRDIEGSPFFNENWKLAEIFLKTGQQFSGVKIKLNLYTQELIYLTQSGKEAIVHEGVVQRVSFSDSDANGNVRARQFITGLPGPEKGSVNFYYESLIHGKAGLVLLIKKKIVNNNSALTPGDNKVFQETETFFILYNEELKAWEKNQDFYLQLFRDQQDKLKEFINKNNLKFKRIEDVKKLIEYYNSI